MDPDGNRLQNSYVYSQTLGMHRVIPVSLITTTVYYSNCIIMCKTIQYMCKFCTSAVLIILCSVYIQYTCTLCTLWPPSSQLSSSTLGAPDYHRPQSRTADIARVSGVNPRISQPRDDTFHQASNQGRYGPPISNAGTCEYKLNVSAWTSVYIRNMVTVC